MEMIETDVIRFFLQLISQGYERLDGEVVVNLVATLLNLCSRPEGIHMFEQEPDAFEILAGLLENEDAAIRSITIGVIYTLLGSRVMHEQALGINLQEIISYMIEHNTRASVKDLRCL